MRRARTALFLLAVITLAACSGRGLTPDDIPTRIPSVEGMATADHLTAIAPPEGLRGSVSYPLVDEDLVFVENWHIDAGFRFDGVFSRTPREVNAETDMQVWFNRLGNQRRVVLEGGGELFGDDSDGIQREAVRLGNETFLLIDGACLPDADEDAATLADLKMGEVIGGVTEATPAGERRVINGQQVWRYTFTQDDLRLPLVRQGDNGRITSMEGELWVARVPPEQDVVVRFYVNLDVENVVLRLFENSLPVSGQLFLRYDLHDVGVNPNITQPNGC